MTEKTLRAVEERQPEVFTAYRAGKAKTMHEAAYTCFCSNPILYNTSKEYNIL